MTHFSISRWIVVCIDISACLTNFAFEDQSTIQRDFHIFRSTSRMNPILIIILRSPRKTRLFSRICKTVLIYPDPNHRNVDRLIECDVNKMISTRCKRCQPHMNIIPCFIHTIDQITDHTRIMPVFRKHIDIGWIGRDL